VTTLGGRPRQTDGVDFPIRFDLFSRLLMTPLGMGARRSRVHIEGDTVHVRMGWAFHATFARSTVVGCSPTRRALLTRGVHGWRGRWLVNGAGQPLVDIELTPGQHGRVLGWRVRLIHLIVSAADPNGLIEALTVQ